MRRPVSEGASVRTTVSTSGSSGTGFRIEQDIVAFRLHGEPIQLDRGIVIVLACSAIIRPLVPRTNHQVFLQRALPDGTAGMRTNSRERMQFAIGVADRVRVVSD